MQRSSTPQPRKLNLNRPICFIDLETTGTDVATARIVEIAIIKQYPHGGRDIKTRLVNPEITIPTDSSDVHGITDEKVKDKPTFKQLSKNLLEFIGDSDIAGYNSNRFDVPLLFNEFARAGIVFDYKSRYLVDVCNIFKIEEQRTLTAAYKFYLDKTLEKAHTAEADILATVDVLNAQLEKYTHLPLDVKSLANYSSYGKEVIDLSGKFARDGDGDVIFTFGKHQNCKCKYQKDFLTWMLGRDFTEDVKLVVRKLLVDEPV